MSRHRLDDVRIDSGERRHLPAAMLTWALGCAVNLLTLRLPGRLRADESRFRNGRGNGSHRGVCVFGPARLPGSLGGGEGLGPGLRLNAGRADVASAPFGSRTPIAVTRGPNGCEAAGRRGFRSDRTSAWPGGGSSAARCARAALLRGQAGGLFGAVRRSRAPVTLRSCPVLARGEA